MDLLFFKHLDDSSKDEYEEQVIFSACRKSIRRNNLRINEAKLAQN